MYAQLGNIIFTPIKGFTEVSFSNEVNLVEHALIDGKPKLQRVGENLETLDVAILLDIAFCVPQSEIDALKTSHKSGEVMPLIMGNGRFVGVYVIRSMDQTNANEAGDGTLLQAEISLSLVEYANEKLNQTSSASSISQAFATVGNAAQTFTALTEYNSIERQASANVTTSEASMSTASDTMASLGDSADLYRPKAKTIVRDMETAGRALDELLSTINADASSELYARSRNLAVSIVDSLALVADVGVEAEALISDIDNGETSSITDRVSSLVQRSIELNSRRKQISQSAASLISYIVTQ